MGLRQLASIGSSVEDASHFVCAEANSAYSYLTAVGSSVRMVPKKGMFSGGRGLVFALNRWLLEHWCIGILQIKLRRGAAARFWHDVDFTKIGLLDSKRMGCTQKFVVWNAARLTWLTLRRIHCIVELVRCQLQAPWLTYYLLHA